MSVLHRKFCETLLRFFRLGVYIQIQFFEILVPTIENWEELCIRVCFSFFFLIFLVLNAKSGITNNHLNNSSEMSY